MGKRGPQPLGNTVELKVGISPDLDLALEQLVQLSGASKATLVRHSLLTTLTTAGFIFPEIETTLVLTRRMAHLTSAINEGKAHA